MHPGTTLVKDRHRNRALSASDLVLFVKTSMIRKRQDYVSGTVLGSVGLSSDFDMQSLTSIKLSGN